MKSRESSALEKLLTEASALVRDYITANREWPTPVYRVTYYRDENCVSVPHTVGFVPAECLHALIIAPRTDEFRLMSIDWMGT